MGMRNVIFLALLAISMLPSIAMAEEVHDVAVIQLDAWSSPAVQGDDVWIFYVLKNEGTVSENVTATVTDLTDAVTLCTDVFYIGPNETVNGTCLWDTSTATIGDHTIEVVADPVPGETDTADNSMITVVTVVEAVHDVAVNSIDAPSSAELGDIVPVDVYVGNEGNVQEYSVQVVLEDLTDGVIIDTKYVDLYTWDTNKKVSFSWNTSSASLGDHTLKATAGPVEGETDTADNSMTTTVTIEEPAVYDGYISSLTTDQPKYTKSQTVYATVVVENTGNQVLDATVRFTYIKPDQSVAYTEDTVISVSVGSSADAQSSYTLPRNAPRGTWTVKAELIYDSQTLDTKTTTFEVVKKL